MSIHNAKFRTAALLALVLSAATLAGCVYEEPYPSYAAAYPSYYPNYYTYPSYSVGIYGGGWHDHDHDHWHR
jgi:hypothetical protein